MNAKEVINEFGEKKIINEDKRKLYNYSNKDKKIIWNAPEIENGREIDFWTNYEECGVINDIEMRLETWNNAIKLAYVNTVNFNSNKNDPNKEIWNGIVQFIKMHPEEFFDEYGDYKRNLVISEEDIKKICI